MPIGWMLIMYTAVVVCILIMRKLEPERYKSYAVYAVTVAILYTICAIAIA